MKEIYNNEHIIIDYNENENEYRLTLFDNYNHYTDELILSAKQMKELAEGCKDLIIEVNDFL